jgi:lipopolysaccharide heptosyltransferase II
VNILQVVPRLDTGGVETGTVDLAKELIARGHKAVVVSSGGNLTRELDAMGAKHYTLPVHRKSPLSVFLMIRKIEEIIKKEKIDIVHARSRACAWSSYFACYRLECNFITTCHGYYNTHFTSRVMGWGKKVIVPSLVIGRHMIDDFDVPEEKIEHVSRGVDLDKFKFNPSYDKKRKSFNVGIVGRISPIKGHKDFLKAISKLARKIPDAKALIIGDVSSGRQHYKDELDILIRQLGISSYVEFKGRKSNIPKVLSNLDVLVLATTTQEAFGRVIIEAGACGVPIVATSVGGVIEIIEDEKEGLLVKPEDPYAIADAIYKLYKDKKLSKKLIDNARKKVEQNYNLQRMADETINIYHKTINNYKILVLKFSSLGDVILSIPSLRSLKNKYKNAKISVLVDLRYKDVLKNSPYVDEVLAYDIKESPIFAKRFYNIIRLIRRENFNLAIDLQNNKKSHILGLLSMIPKRYGYRRRLGFLLTDSLKDDNQPVDPILHQERVLNLLGVDILDKSLKLWPTKEDFSYVDELLKKEWVAKEQKLVGFNISASSKWQTKKWPLDKFANLADQLTQRYNIRIVITGSLADKKEAEELAQQTKSKPIIACGKTDIMQLAALIGKCEVYLTADSAPMHIAAAVNTPFVALFGPTDPKRHLPPASQFSIIYKDIKCSPCYKTKCESRECLKQISSEEVFKEMSKWIKK